MREGLYAIVNIQRSTLGQTGSGHFCPISGFHNSSKSILLFDTARFKYPPHWVTIKKVFEAINTVDEDTDKLRGLIVLSEKEKISKGEERTITQS
jgi:glutathione gamma-glutamylcysteinyltransferase